MTVYKRGRGVVCVLLVDSNFRGLLTQRDGDGPAHV